MSDNDRERNPIEEINKESFSLKEESLNTLNLPSSFVIVLLLKLEVIAAKGIDSLLRLSITIPDISWECTKLKDKNKNIN